MGEYYIKMSKYGLLVDKGHRWYWWSGSMNRMGPRGLCVGLAISLIGKYEMERGRVISV